ncbi:Alpha/Beta hydrolase protein [Pisolithus thermaeus]|nr:Alpha/Beta hydrolase protein [Pisolithus thermaeus]
MRLIPLILPGVITALASVTSAKTSVVGRDASSPHTQFISTKFNGTVLRYVTDSGICETTPNVTQYSGYVEVGKNMFMWFWFFEARHSPETAPFTLWWGIVLLLCADTASSAQLRLNGGPGCSSMMGLFQENGPCQVNPDGETTRLNPYSWNNVSNMIYIDQPIGTGFSYGTDTVNSTEAAAPFVWKAFQILFESRALAKYRSRDFVFATESYGGHYGPDFVTYFDERNAKIADGSLDAEPIVVSALLINNGWIDPLIQNIAYYTFAQNAPGYGQLLPDAVLANISQALWGEGGCVEQERACYAAGNSSASDTVCLSADNYCGNYVVTPAMGNYDPYDLRQNSSALFPPEYYINYLSIESVKEQIGAETTYEECPNKPYFKIIKTGDDARTFLPDLSQLANSGLKILIWAGDTDIICNWVGVYAAVRAMDWYGNEELNNTSLTNITLNEIPIASVANVDNFTFARVFGAGHEIPAFKPAAALEIFTQVVRGEQLHSV